jgi:hypothetical protein
MANSPYLFVDITKGMQNCETKVCFFTYKYIGNYFTQIMNKLSVQYVYFKKFGVILVLSR